MYCLYSEKPWTRGWDEGDSKRVGSPGMMGHG